MKSLNDAAAMQLAIDCARTGLGYTFPNPIVGAVIVNAAGELISEGAHLGTDHAEVIAIKAAGIIAEGTTLYVTLEPCNHHGKTPPCVDAIIAAGITRVVYAISDPNQMAAGGAQALRAAGVEVIAGVMESEAKFENRDWLTKIETGRPRFIWKIASTMDGKVAASDGTSKWITSELSRADVAQMRSQADAIVTSTATVITDDSLLTSKGIGGNPVRIVMGNTPLPKEAKILGLDAETKIIASCEIQDLINFAIERGFNSVLIEAGPTFGTALLRAGIVDEIVLFQAPTFLGAGIPAIGDLGITTINERLDFEIASVDLIGADIKITLLKSNHQSESGR